MPRRADLLWTALAIALSLAVLRLGTPDPTQNDRAPDLLGALLAIAACAPLAVRRAYPLAAAVVALPFAGAALALGYLVIPAVLVGLVLCSLAAALSAQRVTVPLAAYAGTVMAAAVGITGEESPVPVRLLGGVAIGVTAVLIGDAIRSERERAREAQAFAQRIAELRDRDVERAVVEERLRIARDVHDITGHHLSAISLQAAGASRMTSDPVAREALERIHGLTSEALGQTRRTLGVLRESGRGRAGTDAPAGARRATARPRARRRPRRRAAHRRAPIARCRTSSSCRAYRVVQEALTNVVRHAGASARRACASTYGDRRARRRGRRRRRRRPRRPPRRRPRSRSACANVSRSSAARVTAGPAAAAAAARGLPRRRAGRGGAVSIRVVRRRRPGDRPPAACG